MGAGRHCRVAALVALGWSTGCAEPVASTKAQAEAWVWELPTGFPEPAVPEDNPMTQAKVTLGQHLFYDTRLSIDEDTACATCHLPSMAFTDGRAVSTGATGDLTRRSAPSLVNVAYTPRLMWANDLIDSLEEQALLPLFGEDPVEHGLSGIEQQVWDTLADDPLYDDLFATAYPEAADSGEPLVTLDHVTGALAAFQRSLIMGDSPYDRYLYTGDSSGFSPEARDGLALFNSERLECYHCHGTFHLSDTVDTADQPFAEYYYHNTGLYNVDGEGSYPASDPGLIEITADPFDMGKFKAPTLRNITLTAPYMHDGSIDTLDGVLDHYAAGGRTLDSGPHAGDGSVNPYKSILVRGFELTDAERAAMHAFFAALQTPGLDAEAAADPFGRFE